MTGSYTRFRDELAAILDERFYTVEWLDHQIATSAIKFLATDDAIILFKFEVYPTGWLELQGMAAAGDLATIKDELIPAAENLAKTMGCGSAEIASREAWVRLLPDYEIYQTTIKKVF